MAADKKAVARGVWDVARAEAAYEAAVEAELGEVTTEVEQLEAALGDTRDGALEQLAAYLLHLDATDAAIAAEKRRLADRGSDVAKARAWARGAVLQLLDGRTTADVGPYSIRTRAGSQSVDVPAALDLAELAQVLPAGVRERVSVAPDKTAIKAALGDPQMAEALGSIGVRLVRGDRGVTIR